METVELAAGARIRRYSLGVDWRLSGSEPGVTVGFKRVQETSAEPRPVSPACFQHRIQEHLEDPGPLTPRRSGRWRFFYYSDPVSPASAQVEGTHVGLDWRTGEQHDLSLGYARHARLTNLGGMQDKALIHFVDPRDPDSAHLTLWSFAGAMACEH